jgi:hypothetical protein
MGEIVTNLKLNYKLNYISFNGKCTHQQTD